MSGISSRRRDWPWSINPYSGRRHVLDWFMWRVATRFKGHPVRLPFGTTTWMVTDD
jgi:hypothetical protein